MGAPIRDRAAGHHASRLAQPRYPDLADPELAAAWHSLQLHWLRTVPGYRQLIRQRVSEARRRQWLADERLVRSRARYAPVDRIGREVDGCG